MEIPSQNSASNLLCYPDKEEGNLNSKSIIKCQSEDAELKVEEVFDGNQGALISNNDSVVEELISNQRLMKSETKMEDSPTVNGSVDCSDQPSSQSDSLDSSQTSATDSQKTTPVIKKSRPHSDSGSSSTPPADKLAKLTPRATRSSQNPDFAAKQRKFLNRVHDPTRRDNSDSENSQGSNTPVLPKIVKDLKNKSAERKSIISSDMKRKSERDTTLKRSAETEEEGSSKKRRTKEPTKVVGGVDSYCWRCHRDGNVIPCEICPRVYHLKCVQIDNAPPKGWMCPECSTVMQAENTDTRSRAMRMLTLDQLCNLLRFALNRMKSHEGAEDFLKAVDVAEFPNYREYIVKPMDLALLERNIKAKMYGSTEAFQADAKWMLHNSIIFNSVQSKFTNTARALLKICRQEMQEIENCPDCYQNAHTRSSDSWFIEACRRPHLLVWAKLKGFPFWPAKAMSTNSENLVDVRFFGAHDRAWVPVSSCFLFSKLSPAPPSNKNKRNLDECLLELECHIKKLKDKFGQFEYPPYKTPYDPNNEDVQLAMFLPKYEAKSPGKRSRLSLHHDGARKAQFQRKSLPTLVESQQVSAPVGLQPMVSFPGTKSTPSSLPLQNKVAPQGEKSAEHTPTKTSSPTGPKKSYRTPLTAAAKKCFANEEQFCVKCNVKIAWDKDSTSKPLCSSCSKIPLQAESQKVKECAKCQTKSCDSWHQAQSGIIYCDTCFIQHQKDTYKLDIQYKKDDRSNVQNTTVRGTVTVQRKLQEISSDVGEPSGSGRVESEELPSPPETSETDVEGTNDNREGRENVEQETTSPTEEVSTNSDSPPKFIITKANGKETPDSSKKVSIVDRLQEKLCFVVEEAIKSHITTEVGSESGENSPEAAETTGENQGDVATEQKKVMQVLLHDLKNDKEMMEKIRESEEHNKLNKSKTGDIEVQTLTDSGSEPDTDGSSFAESDSCVVNEDNNKKRKQNNINNVVKTLKERKSSVEEKTDKNNKSPTLKGSSTLMLDDSNDEVPVLIIDEGDSNGSDGKRAIVKMDKNRRKGTPAKVYSRSSTSTECSDNSIEDQTRKSVGNKEVLDEVSGQFRRPSSESNLTITLVTDDEAPQKKTKDFRSVNISKSLSLSVVNDSSANLETDCVESDLDDQVIVDSVIKKVIPRPTARKTLPNPPRSIDLPILQEKGVQVTQNKVMEPEMVKLRPPLTLVDQVASPPPLINLRAPNPNPPRVYSAKGQRTVTVGTSLPVTPTSVSSPPKNAELGPANAQLDEAVKKMSGQLRTLMEDMLRGMSETGATEATVKAMQMEVERLQWRHRQEIAELKHNTDLLVMEIRASLEAEKQRALLDAKHKYEMDKEQAVQETKRKQWCAFCQKEAQLYCCWNTAYCSYNCQQSHWMPHMNTCLNKQQGNNSDVSPRAAPPRTPNYIPGGQMHVPYAWPYHKEDFEESSLYSRHGPARRRCGQCQGCVSKPCGQCYGCTKPKSHSVCKHRKCSYILSKTSQRVRQQLMPPPPPPPPYHQPYGPNQMYSSGSPPIPRFTNGLRPSHPYGGDPSYHRSSL